MYIETPVPKPGNADCTLQHFYSSKLCDESSHHGWNSDPKTWQFCLPLTNGRLFPNSQFDTDHLQINAHLNSNHIHQNLAVMHWKSSPSSVDLVSFILIFICKRMTSGFLEVTAKGCTSLSNYTTEILTFWWSHQKALEKNARNQPMYVNRLTGDLLYACSIKPNYV